METKVDGRLQRFVDVYGRNWWGVLIVYFSLLAIFWGGIWLMVEPWSPPDRVTVGNHYISRPALQFIVSLLLAAYASLVVAKVALRQNAREIDNQSASSDRARALEPGIATPTDWYGKESVENIGKLLGWYEGRSHDIRVMQSGREREREGTGNIEHFNVREESGRVRVSGISTDVLDGSEVSQWEGGLWRIEAGELFVFAMELIYRTHKREYGIFTLRKAGPERCSGAYFSADPNTHVMYRYTAQKVG